MPDDGTTTSPEPSDAGDLHLRIGHYVLKREIATGGMGTVYEAVQDNPRRVVAIKLMRSGMSSRSHLRRFEFESQLLARLRHPGIAQVFEAGTHQKGDQQIPFYAMEYIPGARSLIEHTLAERLPLEQRLKLFVDVCDAIHHANQKGIIHRDIKPGNLLVDRAGQVKVIDFGVARAPDSDQVSATLQTQSSQLIGTLQYMSPEQCDGDPGSLDARSDVYSLGVVLYELVCGRAPHDLTRVNVSDAARVIREVAPPAPRELNPSISRDLETVILRAIQKPRSRRYDSADALGADIRRVMQGEPVSARRDSPVYVGSTRLKQLMVRHHVGTVLVVAIASLLLIELLYKAVDRSRFLQYGYENWVMKTFPPAHAPRFRNVVVIALSEYEDPAALAAEQKIDGFDPKERHSFRRLYAKVIERISRHNPRGIVIDVRFAERSDAHDALLVEALKPIFPRAVVAGGAWKPSRESPYPISANILPVVIAGSTVANLGQDREPWLIHLVVRKRGSDVQPSLALLGAWTHQSPNKPEAVGFDPTQPQVHVSDANSNSVTFPLTDNQQADQSNREFNLEVGDVVGSYIVDLPRDASLIASTSDFSTVLQGSDSQLRELVRDKVVVIGDARPNMDGPYRTPDGRQVCGFTAQAAAIESLIANEPIRRPHSVGILGMYIWGRHWLDAAAVALAAIAAAALAGKHPILCRAAMLLLAGAVVAGCIVAYQQYRHLYNPIVAVAGTVLAGELISATERIRRRSSL